MKVCVHCFNDLELKQFIVTNSDKKGKCDYCNDGINSELIEISELLDFFAEFIEIFKFDSKGIPLVQKIQNEWNLFSGETVCHRILSDILLVLNSSLTNPQETVNYIDEIVECSSYWKTLKEEIKWERRFLVNIDKLEELGWGRFLNDRLELSISEPLFRARLHYIGNEKEIETTLYEVRATFLDEVSVGTFQIRDNSKVSLVDFTESASAFAKVDEIVESTKRMLLKRYISADLSKPIRRYDSELEYIPTQFICEYIRYITGADGILFNSSLHNGGKNIVLFEQDKVECISVSMHRITKVEIEALKILR